MQKLKGFDATWFYVESQEMPCHIGAVQVLKLAPGQTPDAFFARFREMVANRLHIAAPYRWKLKETPLGLDHPVWHDDPEFDLDNHLRRVRLPAPGTRRQLAAAAAREQARGLDRARPLFEYVIFEGLQDGHIAVHSKLHHAFLDGAAGKALTIALYDLSPEGRVEELRAHTPRPAPGLFEIAAAAAGNLARAPFSAAANALGLLGAAGGFARAVLAPMQARPALPFAAPRTRFNGRIGARRSFGLVSVPLALLKRIKSRAGVSVNDVVLAGVAGALRRYLDETGGLPRDALMALAPVSLRKEGDQAFENRVSAMLVDLATELDDPLERLLEIHQSAEAGKRLAHATAGALPEDFVAPGAPAVIGALAHASYGLRAAEWTKPSFNVVVSNVPVATFPLYIAGAEMVGNYPISIVGHGAALNVTCCTYRDHVDFGVTACAKALPDAARFTALIADAFAELAERLALEAEARGIEIPAEERALPGYDPARPMPFSPAWSEGPMANQLAAE